MIHMAVDDPEFQGSADESSFMASKADLPEVTRRKLG
jgi:hypothetical protein